MPKMKTKRTLAKRVKRTGSGQLKRQQELMFLTLLDIRQINKIANYVKPTLVSKSDYKRIKHLLQD
ncbi:50S ribosomal protein L35 [Erysipelothrix sp. Poltava]|nr:50S ribosomal protein L35 [Erysipelothrix sp. Poltava]